jgi:hypothetical protein
MFNGLQLKVVFAGVIGALLLGMLGTAYWQYTRTVAENRELQAKNATLETAIDTQTVTIEAQREAITEWAEHSRALVLQMEALQRVGENAREETRRLNELFRSHDLGGLAARRPGLIEDRVQRGADRASCLLEQASGAYRPDC